MECWMAVYQHFIPKRTIILVTHYVLYPNHFVTPSDLEESLKKIRLHIIKTQPHFLPLLQLAVSANYEVRNKVSNETKLIRGSFNIHNRANHLLDWQGIDLNELQEKVELALQDETIAESLQTRYQDSKWMLSGEIKSVTLQFQVTLNAWRYENKPLEKVEGLKIYFKEDAIRGVDIRSLIRQSWFIRESEF